MYAQMHSSDRLHKPWKETKRNDSNTNDIIAYESLLTVTLKIDDNNGKFSRFQNRLQKKMEPFFRKLLM